MSEHLREVEFMPHYKKLCEELGPARMVAQALEDFDRCGNEWRLASASAALEGKGQTAFVVITKIPDRYLASFVRAVPRLEGVPRHMKLMFLLEQVQKKDAELAHEAVDALQMLDVDPSNITGFYPTLPEPIPDYGRQRRIVKGIAAGFGGLFIAYLSFKDGSIGMGILGSVVAILGIGYIFVNRWITGSWRLW